MEKPVAKISVNASTIMVGQSIAFSAEDSIDPDGEIVYFRWSFSDDRKTYEGRNTTRQYKEAGNFTVSLTVKDDDKLTDTAKLDVTVILEKYVLVEAVETGYIIIEITGRSGLLGGGISSGDAIDIKIERLIDYVIEIEVPIGIILVTDKAQNMVVEKVSGRPIGKIGIYPAERILLWNINQTYTFRAYCIDFHKPNPTSSTTFSIGGIVNPEILSVLDILDELSENVTSIAAIQTAIFVVTDDVSREELEERFPEGLKVLTEVRIILEAAGFDVSTKRLFGG